MSAHFEDEKTTVGNAAAMREALVAVKERVIDATTRHDWSTDDAHSVCNTIEAALSWPPRNCDVGTAEEQAERMRRKFCAKQKRDGIIDCSLCPIRHAYRRDCTCGRSIQKNQFDCLEGKSVKIRDGIIARPVEMYL